MQLSTNAWPSKSSVNDLAILFVFYDDHLVFITLCSSFHQIKAVHASLKLYARIMHTMLWCEHFLIHFMNGNRFLWLLLPLLLYFYSKNNKIIENESLRTHNHQPNQKVNDLKVCCRWLLQLSEGQFYFSTLLINFVARVFCCYFSNFSMVCCVIYFLFSCHIRFRWVDFVKIAAF